MPPRSRRSFLELLCGCLISPDGWVTRALSHISLRCHWTTYYKLLERESLRTQVLAIAQVRWLLSALPPLPMVELIIDDTLVLRHSTKAPGATIHFDHSHKETALLSGLVMVILLFKWNLGTILSLCCEHNFHCPYHHCSHPAGVWL
ncbi:MAG: transposase [Acidithiobacillus sp.]|uniref:Uncharacterized protein n=1 Tax=Acidithiobacillus thiooxidans ATCC 19377 TaxID=637390 RepID=A0A5P9XT76_ACITH|nr:transposase [Acidithiobacillus thiooxidans]MDA8153916.1 transposase [Acidithiobacillus sp.]QFX96819.1 hypothetical protein GCD22_02654 [Acidithiobacillus thiooxidans ATCC 19377]